jgi:hypothetical protein
LEVMIVGAPGGLCSITLARVATFEYLRQARVDRRRVMAMLR